MNQAEALKKARQFADTAYNAASETIARDTHQKLSGMTASLAARGLIASGGMVSETARINAERYTALLHARLDALLEGYELYGIDIDDQLVESATMVAEAKNWSGDQAALGSSLVEESFMVSWWIRASASQLTRLKPR